MNDEIKETEEQKIERLAREWLSIPHNGLPPTGIRAKVKELSQKGQNIKIRKEKKIQREIDRADKIERKKELVKAKALKKSIEKVQKTEEFLEAFIRNEGNLTQTGLDVFGATNKNSASAMAGEFMKNNQHFIKQFLERKGYTLGWMVELLAKKAVESKNADFLDRLFRIAGYGELQPAKQYTGPQVVNIIETQKKVAKEYGFSEEAIDGEVEE